LVVAGDVAERLCLCAGELAFGDDQPQALDDLVDLAAQEAFGALVDERLGLTAALGVERVGDFPELLQRVQEVEDERDVLEGFDDALLERAFAVGEDLPGFAGARGRGG